MSLCSCSDKELGRFGCQHPMGWGQGRGCRAGSGTGNGHCRDPLPWVKGSGTDECLLHGYLPGELVTSASLVVA